MDVFPISPAPAPIRAIGVRFCRDHQSSQSIRRVQKGLSAVEVVVPQVRWYKCKMP